MGVRYDVTGHPLLTGKAALLGPTELSAHNMVAEIVLGLWKFTAIDQASNPDGYDQATSATALQVSYQVESGIEAFVLSSMARGGRHYSFRGGRHRMPVAHSLAKKIVNAIKPQT